MESNLKNLITGMFSSLSDSKEDRLLMLLGIAQGFRLSGKEHNITVNVTERGAVKFKTKDGDRNITFESKDEFFKAVMEAHNITITI